MTLTFEQQVLILIGLDHCKEAYQKMAEASPCLREHWQAKLQEATELRDSLRGTLEITVKLLPEEATA